MARVLHVGESDAAGDPMPLACTATVIILLKCNENKAQLGGILKSQERHPVDWPTGKVAGRGSVQHP